MVPIGIQAPLSLQPSSIASSSSNTPVANPANPFTKGVIAIKNNQPQTATPSHLNYYRPTSSVPSNRSEGETDKPPPFSNPASAVTSPNFNLQTPKQLVDPYNYNALASNNNAAATVPVRESLHSIKRKVTEKSKEQSTGDKSARRTSINQSSNRDSEELTPLPADDDHELIFSQNDHYPSSVGKPKGVYRDDSKQFYDTRYYEEKKRDHFHGLEEKDSSISDSFGYDLSFQKVPLDRGVSVESVADDVGEDYSRDLAGSNEGRGSSTFQPVHLQNDELKFMHSSTEIHSSGKIGDKSRKYYYPSKYSESPPEERPTSSQPQSQYSSRQPNIHAGIMKKSASAAEGVGETGIKSNSNRSSPVPRLTGIDSQGNLVNQRTSDKYASSASARISRPEPVDDPVKRPYSSKASFSYNDNKSSKASSLVSSPVESGAKVVVNTSQRAVGQNPFGRQSSGTTWKCGKCFETNVQTVNYCEYCGLKRGLSGEKGNESVVPRFT
jgi:hypothetical protein